MFIITGIGNVNKDILFMECAFCWKSLNWSLFYVLILS